MLQLGVVTLTYYIVLNAYCYDKIINITIEHCYIDLLHCTTNSHHPLLPLL
jgi:hypothetical protein